MNDQKQSGPISSEQLAPAPPAAQDIRPVTPAASDNVAAFERTPIPRRPLAVEVRFLNETAAWW